MPSNSTHLAKDGMLALAQVRAPPVEEVVVGRVDKELGTAAVGLASIGHGKRLVGGQIIRVADTVKGELVQDAAAFLLTCTIYPVPYSSLQSPPPPPLLPTSPNPPPLLAHPRLVADLVGQLVRDAALAGVPLDGLAVRGSERRAGLGTT